MIQAIETRYKGFRFRSRLEARYAVGFDEVGIEWEYEPQGYKLSSGESYLPDFYLPAQKMFVEVKGGHEFSREYGGNLYLAGKMGGRELTQYRNDGFALYAHSKITGPVDSIAGHSGWLHGTDDGDMNHYPSVDIRHRCFSQIDQADDVFAFITTADCYGTLAELGYARAKAKRIHVAFACSLDADVVDDMWFAWKNWDEELPVYAASLLEGYSMFFKPTAPERKMAMLCEESKARGMLVGDCGTGDCVAFDANGYYGRDRVWPSLPLSAIWDAARSARFEHGESGVRR